MRRLLSLALALTLIYSASLAQQVENLQRAIVLLDETMSKCFSGSSTNLKMYDTYDTSSHRGSGVADVWPYTAALEAHCSVLEALDLLKGFEPQLYADHHDRLVTRLRSLYDNLAYYRGSFTLVSYAQQKTWRVYGVHRSNTKGTATVTGIENVYDDQMWICRELVRAYRLTGDEDYLTTAYNLAEYCIDGWDCCLDDKGNEYGGISWGPGYNSKHSCSNGPLVQPLVWLSEIYAAQGENETANYKYCYIEPDKSRTYELRRPSDVFREFAVKIYEWQKKNLLNTSTGVYYDMLGADNTIQYIKIGNRQYRDHVNTGNRGGTAYTYNTGTMIAGSAELGRITGTKSYFDENARLCSASVSQFTKTVTKDGEAYKRFPTDEKATSGFNCWFNDVLIRACVDAYAMGNSSAQRSSKILLDAIQKDLDYAWEHYLQDGFLPINLLEGWQETTVTKGFHQLAFAAEYAMLAVWHERMNPTSVEPADDPFDVGAVRVETYDLSGRHLSHSEKKGVVVERYVCADGTTASSRVWYR
ncbi:MAG: alpha-1,6-mannanase [Bacteroidaceae bacterium]|nr:alpha-1,6-mannanase [Bacteroidaceae bacterium]